MYLGDITPRVNLRTARIERRAERDAIRAERSDARALDRIQRYEGRASQSLPPMNTTPSGGSAVVMPVSPGMMPSGAEPMPEAPPAKPPSVAGGILPLLAMGAAMLFLG